jgi:hypothetical protein
MHMRNYKVSTYTYVQLMQNHSSVHPTSNTPIHTHNLARSYTGHEKPHILLREATLNHPANQRGSLDLADSFDIGFSCTVADWHTVTLSYEITSLQSTFRSNTRESKERRVAEDALISSSNRSTYLTGENRYSCKCARKGRILRWANARG